MLSKKEQAQHTPIQLVPDWWRRCGFRGHKTGIADLSPTSWGFSCETCEKSEQVAARTRAPQPGEKEYPSPEQLAAMWDDQGQIYLDLKQHPQREGFHDIGRTLQACARQLREALKFAGAPSRAALIREEPAE